MEPITGATAFADVVSLLGQFLSGRKDRKAQTIADYLEWLRRENHQQVVSLLTDNAAATKAVNELLAGQHNEVLEMLAALDATLSGVARHLPNFQALAIAVHPESVLSDQAVSILRQMNAANASTFLEVSTLSETEYIFMGSAQGNLDISDERFIEDDLQTLCELGMLRPGINSQGYRNFTITRLGAKIGG